MAKMFKCDVTGKLCEGAPVGKVDVTLGDSLKAEVRIYRLDGGHFVQADIGPEAAARILDVLAVMAPKAVAAVKDAVKK